MGRQGIKHLYRYTENMRWHFQIFHMPPGNEEMCHKSEQHPLQRKTKATKCHAHSLTHVYKYILYIYDIHCIHIQYECIVKHCPVERINENLMKTWM